MTAGRLCAGIKLCPGFPTRARPTKRDEVSEAVQEVSLSFRPQGEILLSIQISQSRSLPPRRRGSFEMTNTTYRTTSGHSGMTRLSLVCHPLMSRFWIPLMSGIQRVELLEGIQNVNFVALEGRAPSRPSLTEPRKVPGTSQGTLR